MLNVVRISVPVFESAECDWITQVRELNSTSFEVVDVFLQCDFDDRLAT
jgi:hypothetical protein